MVFMTATEEVGWEWGVRGHWSRNWCAT